MLKAKKNIAIKWTYVQNVFLDDSMDDNADQQVEEGSGDILQSIGVVDDQVSWVLCKVTIK